MTCGAGAGSPEMHALITMQRAPFHSRRRRSWRSSARRLQSASSTTCSPLLTRPACLPCQPSSTTMHEPGRRR